MRACATNVRRPRAARRHGGRTAGFTLLEVMAALSVFLIGIVSVLALLSTGTRLHQESQSTALAADAAEEVLLLASREVAELAPEGGGALPEQPAAQPVPGRPELTYHWTVRAAPGGGLYLLEVEVGWKQGGKQRVQRLERVLPRLRSARVDAARLWAPR